MADYKVLLTKDADGPFSINIKAYGTAQFVLFESNVSKDELVNGKVITVPDNTETIELINNNNVCGNSVKQNVPILVFPTPTPTTSYSDFPSPSPTPNITPTPSPSAITETNVQPVWLEGISVTYDANSHDCSLWVNATEDVDLRISRSDGFPINGLSWQGFQWNQDTWIPGTTDYAPPFDEVFRLNPVAFAAGGITPSGSYVVRVRRNATQSPVYKFNWTAPSSSVVSQTPIQTASPVIMCAYGPKIYNNVVTYSPGRIDFGLDGSGVSSFKWRIIFGGNTTIASGVTSMVNSNGDAIFVPSNKPYVTFPPLSDGSYSFEIEGNNCSSSVSSQPFNVSTYVPPVSSSLYGVYSSSVGGRNYSFTKSPGITLTFNNDGTISDTTVGLNNSGSITRTSTGLYRYYTLGLSRVETYDRNYVKCQNVSLRDGGYTLYVTDSPIDNYAGYIASTPVGSTSNFNHIHFTIVSDTPSNTPIFPTWTKLSRHPLYTAFGTVKDWYFNKKWVSIPDLKVGDTKVPYKAVGVIPYADLDSATPQTSWIDKLDQFAATPTSSEFYNKGKDASGILGSSLKSVYADQFIDDKGLSIYPIIAQYYKGLSDKLTEITGESNTKNKGIFGSIGSDELSNYTILEPLFKTFQTYQESLTTELYNSKLPDGAWQGLASYFSNDHISYRNMAFKINLNQNPSSFVLELLYKYDRFKLGVRTHQNVDRDRSAIVAVSPWLVDTTSDSILYKDPGETILFPNGEFTGFSSKISADQLVGFKVGFWSTFIGEGVEILLPANYKTGIDSTKIDRGSDSATPATWKPTSGPAEAWVSGQNGAPVLANEVGLKQSIHSAFENAVYAGTEVSWNIQNRSNISISYIAHSSNVTGGYTPVGGTGGLNINGHGNINRNAFDLWHIVNGRKGIALKGVGNAGIVYVYENPFLSPHLTETVTIEGNTFTAYGNQVYVING